MLARGCEESGRELSSGRGNLAASCLEARLKKSAPALLFLAALILFCFLRLRNLGHLLLWDEAQFVLYARSFVEGAGDPQWFYWSRFFHLHPPVYLYLCSFANRLWGSRPGAYEALSFLFSSGAFLVTWRMGVFLFGRRTGAWASFFLAVTPASSFFDTWIKQDAAAAFFAVLALYLFMKKRYELSGLAAGLGMLCKETAAFALLAMLTFSLAARHRDRLRGILKIGAIAALMSAWWYLFISDYVGHFAQFFLGRGTEAGIWRKPWHYYFSGMPLDLGWAGTVLAVWGCLACLRRSSEGCGDHLFPLCWFLPTYAFLSFSAGKPYWMVSTALPALALLAGIGADSLTRWVLVRVGGRRGSLLSLAFAVLLLSWAAAGVLMTDEASYNGNRHEAYWAQAVASRDDARFLSESMLPDERAAVIFNSRDIWDPTLLHYFGRPGLIPAKAAFLRDAEEMAGRVREMGISWIYIGIDADYDQELRFFLPQIKRLLPVEAMYQNGWRIILRLGTESP